MAETLIVLAPGEERLIRVRCGAAAPAMNGEIQEAEIVPPEPNPNGDMGPPMPNANNLSNLPRFIEPNRNARKSRKQRKNEGATRKNRKQSGGKRGMNPFMSFAAKERKNIMSSNPGMAVTEVGKELGKRWRALSEAEKKKYST